MSMTHSMGTQFKSCNDKYICCEFNHAVALIVCFTEEWKLGMNLNVLIVFLYGKYVLC